MPYLQAQRPSRPALLALQRAVHDELRQATGSARSATGRYKLIERYDGSREFYDLSTDALETRNLLQGSLSGTQRSALNRLDRQMDTLLDTR